MKGLLKFVTWMMTMVDHPLVRSFWPSNPYYDGELGVRLQRITDVRNGPVAALHML